MQLFVQGEGIRGIELITVPDGATISELVQAAQQVGLPQGKPVFIFLEGQEKESARYSSANGKGDDKKLAEIGIGQHARVDIHSEKQIHVTVHYGAETKQNPFSPSTTVAAVRTWAVEKFKIDPAQAAEHVLQLCKSDVCPDADIHIGGLATGHPAAVCFDLLTKHRPQG